MNKWINFENKTSQMSEYEIGIYLHAISAYGFLVQDQAKPFSLSEFADEIEKAYSVEDSRKAEVCRILRKYS